MRIDPAEGADAIELKVELERGATVSGVVVNAQGEPVKRALMTNRWNIHPTSPFWRGTAREIMGGKFEITGMPAEETRTYFIDSKRRLGATAMLKGGDSNAKVGLLPCGMAAGRFVDKDGKPVPDHDIRIYMVVTPGRKQDELQGGTGG